MLNVSPNFSDLADAPLLELQGVRKAFGGVQALADASLELYPGSVTALLGENGAGKSTLVKILTGNHQPDGGEIRIDGCPVRIASPLAAQRLGISVIHQESVVFDSLTVAENIFIAARPRRWGLVDWHTMRHRAAEVLARIEADIDPLLPMGTLSIAQKHLVQIARALGHDSRIVIMDEPTAALSHHEAADLFRLIRQLQAEGRALLFIGHKFDELFAIADRYTVFRDGRTVGAGQLRDTDPDRLVNLMVGRAVEQVFPKTTATIGEEVLRIEGLTRVPEFRDVHLSVRSGEILGVYGLVGAGRSETLQSVFGLQRPDAGRIVIDGLEVEVDTPQAAIRHGLALVPEDRQRQGAILDLPIADNVSLASLSRYSRWGLLRRRLAWRDAANLLARLQIKAAALDQAVGELSGGNQQKVVLAKWLATRPRVLILDEPTKGIDIGAKAAVHRLMGEFVQEGLAVVLISSELPEVLGLADRIAVMSHGRVRACFARADATPERIIRAAAGLDA